MKVTRLVTVNWRTRKIAGGSIGDVVVRSTATNATEATTPIPSMARTVGSLHPRAGPSMRPKVTPARARTASTAPAQSTGRSAGGARGPGTGGGRGGGRARALEAANTHSNKKNPPPRRGGVEVAPVERSGRRGHAAEPGPGADR